MGKKAQGMSLNTIIIAIIVLIVLVVLIMIFTGYFGTRFTPQVTSCSNAGGECKFECGFDAFGNAVATISADCPGSGEGTQVCCSKGLGSGEQKAASDVANCGQEGAVPCSSGGQACNSAAGLKKIGATCEKECTSPNTCVSSGSCQTQASSGACSSGVCCAVEKTEDSTVHPPPTP